MSDSLTHDLIRQALRLGFKLPARGPLPVKAIRRGMETLSGLLLRADTRDIHAINLAGVPTERHGAAEATAILYLHGGIFIAGSPRTHRRLGRALAQELGSSVYVIDYRLAPEHPYPAALDDAETAWDCLRGLGYDAEQIVIAGDSAGGGLALALAQRLRDREQSEHAAALILISPYADLTTQSDSMHSLAGRDPMLSAKVLRRGGDYYRGPLAADDPRVSPLFGDMHHLPPILIQVGSEEVLLDDALRLEGRVRAAGGDIECQVWPGLWHDFQLFQGLIPEAGQAVAEIRRYLDDEDEA